jgi:hypothetical protein
MPSSLTSSGNSSPTTSGRTRVVNVEKVPGHGGKCERQIMFRHRVAEASAPSAKRPRVFKIRLVIQNELSRFPRENSRDRTRGMSLAVRRGHRRKELILNEISYAATRLTRSIMSVLTHPLQRSTNRHASLNASSGVGQAMPTSRALKVNSSITRATWSLLRIRACH